MPRNTRLFNDLLAAPYVYEGDVTECAKWRGWAEAKLKHMLNSKGALSCTFMPVEGVEIRIDTRPNRVSIKTGSGLYLESGFLDLLSAARCNEGTYKPAVLHYSPTIAAYVSSIETPIQGTLNSLTIQGEQLPDGYKSKSVGGKTLATSVFDPCGNVYSLSTYDYVKDAEKVLSQKQAQNRVPSSMYSGKMRLFVQSLYGAMRSDYRINVGVNGLPMPADYNLYLETTERLDFQLAWDYPETCGIYTTEDYSYYLIKVKSSEVEFYKLSCKGKTLKKALANGDVPQADISKVEAYILSTAKLSSTPTYKVPLTGSVPGGLPLAYGWKFNRKGDEARIVIHQDYLGNNTKFRAHELKLTITGVDGAFKATVTTISTGFWAHSPYIVAWVPEWFQYSQMQFGNFYDWTYMDTNGDCPIYGWFQGDEYLSIGINASIAFKNTTATTGIRSIVGLDGTCESEFLGYEDTNTTYSGANGTVSLLGVDGYSSRIENATSIQGNDYYWQVQLYGNPLASPGLNGLHQSYTLCSTGSTVAQYLASIGAWGVAGGIYYQKWDSEDSNYYYGRTLRVYEGFYRWNQTIKGAATGYPINSSTKFVLIVPLDDCESCVTGKYTSESYGSKNVWYGAMGSQNATPYSAELVRIKKEKFGAENISFVSVLSDMGRCAIQSSFTNSTGGTPVGWLYNQNIKTGNLECVIDESGPFYDEIDGLEIRNEATDWLYSYAWATFGSTLGGDTVVVNASYNGANRVYHGEGDGENNNGYLYDGAVGWA